MNTTQQKLFLLSGEYQQDAEILHFVQWLNTLKFTALSYDAEILRLLK